MNTAPNLTDRPHAVHLEQELIGECLRNPDILLDAAAQVRSEDFYDSLHARIWTFMAERAGIEGAVTPYGLVQAFANDEALKRIGGGDYIFNLADAQPPYVDVPVWCAEISDTAKRRELLELGEGLVAATIAGTANRQDGRPVDDVANEFEDAIRGVIAGRPRADDPVSLYQAASAVVERLDRPKEKRRPLVSFGIAGLDFEYGGMAPGDLVFLAGRTGMGKTAAAVAIADHVAGAGFGVVMHSLEMKNDQVAERWLSLRAFRRGVKTPYSLIRLDRVHDEGKTVLAQETAAIANLPFIIDQKRGITLNQIAARTRRERMKMRRDGHDLGLVIIDHIQRIRPDGAYRGNMVSEVTETARGLKDLAGALDVPVLCLSQLNRAVESRDDKIPMLSDLRQSGAIEEEADMVLLLHRPEYYASKNKPDVLKSGMEAVAKWEEKLRGVQGFIFINAAKVRHGKDDEFKAKCEIAYNWIGERV